MTPFRARLVLLAMMAIPLATAGNALFLQERPRTLSASSASRLYLNEPAPAAAPLPAPAAFSPETPAERLQAALQRELARHGYADQLAQTNGLRLAVLAYEFDNGMPLTGEPAEALLKHILFDLNQAPRGIFADRAEANQKLVTEIQKTLLGLGFFRGALSGRMDVWTAGAVRDFERHRRLPLTGRLSETTLLELIAYSGQPLQLSSG
ncbi:MAG: peptidoglycan-binding domain-containing protein [Rhodomicrobium sp.]